MSNDSHKKILGFTDLVGKVVKHNHDKVIHQDLKETEFDDIVMSVIAPESDRLRNAISRHSEKLTQHTEYEILTLAQPVQTDQLLRISFWDEVNTAIAENRPVSERKIWNGVCSCTYWYRVRDELEWKMAYVLTPVMSYAKANKLGLELGQKAMLAILSAPNVDSKGRIENIKLAQLQKQVFEMIQDRVHGKAVQRIQSHNTNVEANKKESIEDIQKELEQLQKKVMPVTIEVDGE